MTKVDYILTTDAKFHHFEVKYEQQSITRVSQTAYTLHHKKPDRTWPSFHVCIRTNSCPNSCPTNFTASDRNGLKQYFPNCSLRTKYYVKIKIYCTKNHILSNLGNNLIVLCIISTVNIWSCPSELLHHT